MITRLLLLIYFLSVSCYLAGQSLQPVFQQFTEQDGLPSNYLNCLFQDRQGFIWIGSDKGLTRFDGTTFKNYTTDDGLSGNMILDITEDEIGNLWIGTFERGICRFDGENFNCWGKDHSISTASSLYCLNENSIMYSSGTGKLFRFDTKTKTGENILDLPMVGVANDIVPFGKNRILFPCTNQIFLITEGKEIEEISFKNGNMAFFIKKGITTSDGETWLLDSYNKSLIQVIITENQLEVIQTLPASDTNADLIEFDQFFISNYEKENQYKIIAKSKKPIQSITNPHAGQNVDALADREGQLWLATVGYGLFVQKGHPYLHQLPQQKGAAYDVEILSDGKIAVGGDQGIWLYDKELQLLGHQPQIKQVRGIKWLDGLGLCVGTLRGFTYFFQDEKALFGSNPEHNIVVSSGFSGAISTQKGEAIFSSYGAGLKLYDGKNMQTIDSPVLPNLMVEGLFQTTHGIWTSSASDGILLISKKENRLFSKQNGLISNNIYTVFEQTPDTVWIGSENGINLWDGDNELKTFPLESDLDVNRVTAFFTDKHQQTWAFSDKYLHSWKNQQWQALKNITCQNIPEGRIYDVAYDATDHRIFVASTTGAFILNLKNIRSSSTPIDLIVSSIETKQSVLDTAKISILEPKDNSIRINFSIPSYLRSTANNCHFRFLENETAWIKAEHPSFFEFKNLPAGFYTLQAVASNPEGEKGQIKTIAKFKILPSLWLRWWAILLELLIGVLLISGIVAWHFQRKEKKRLAALKIERELQTERERISRDLHDNIGAQLTNITYKLDLAAHQSKEASNTQRIEKVSDDTRDTMKLLRDTIWALQKDEFSINDLAEKVQRYVIRLEGLEVKFQIEKRIEEDSMLSPKEALHLFRIIQEAVQNIIKHASASEAKIIFEVNQQQFNISISDNGKGMNTSNKNATNHYGLGNMAFRAKEINANFSINKNEPNGTKIKLFKPK